MSTPRQTAGPFYPVQLPLDDDNDLTTVAGKPGIAKGQFSDLTGKIVDLNGRPLSGLRIEIWQCDANGRYRHPYEKGEMPIDDNFQGHGKTLTDTDGNYRFRTIKPVAYPGRTPHIHVAVFPEGERPFITQLYIKDNPENHGDFLFNSIPTEKRHMVQAKFSPASDESGLMQASFDIVLDQHQGTPRERKRIG
jgi:protocatechuate 3,4-dioxygenase beta subunit